jgi:hypothetical protein
MLSPEVCAHFSLTVRAAMAKANESVLIILPGAQMAHETSLFFIASTPFLQPTQPPTQRVPGALSRGLKRPQNGIDPSTPTINSGDVKSVWSYTSNPPFVFMAWCLINHKDTFPFYFNVVILLNSEALRSWILRTNEGNTR